MFVFKLDDYKKLLSMWESLHDEKNAAIAQSNLERLTEDEATRHEKTESP